MCISNSYFHKQTNGVSYTGWRHWGCSPDGTLRPAVRHHHKIWTNSTKRDSVRRPSTWSGGNDGLHAECWIGSRRSGIEIFGQVRVHGVVSVFKVCNTRSRRHRNAGYLSTEQTILKLYVPKRFSGLATAKQQLAARKRIARLLRKRYRVPVVLL